MIFNVLFKPSEVYAISLVSPPISNNPWIRWPFSTWPGGEREVDKHSAPTSVVNNWVAEREDGDAADVQLRGYYGQYVLSFFLAPVVYLEAFPHSACAALFLRHRERTPVHRDEQQNAVRPQLWAVPPGLGLLGGNKTLCLYFPPFHFGISWAKLLPFWHVCISWPRHLQWFGRVSLDVLHLQLILLYSGFLWLRAAMGMPWWGAHHERWTNIWEQRRCFGSAWQ